MGKFDCSYLEESFATPIVVGGVIHLAFMLGALVYLAQHAVLFSSAMFGSVADKFGKGWPSTIGIVNSVVGLQVFPSE